jgi:tRNA(Ile)-lysidine synthase
MNPLAQPDKGATTWADLCRRFAATFSPQRHTGIGVVVAVSGGADSVALLRLVVDAWAACPAASIESIVVAHYNHGTRGEEAERDQRFVRDLACRLTVRFMTETDTGTPQKSSEPEVTAKPAPPLPTDEASLREKRYAFLRRCLADSGARCLLTAHTADDQVETLLHHLFRGTGPGGLCGIPKQRPIADDFMLVRPLLGFRRETLRAGLNEIGQSWCEDRSNHSLRYRRNWIRQELLPMIRSQYPEAEQAILRLIETQSHWNQSLRDQARDWIEEHVRLDPKVARIVRGPVSTAVFGLAIGILWDHFRWPRQQLDARHHQRLWQLVCSSNADGDAVRQGRATSGNRVPTTSLNLPGQVRAWITGEGEVQIERILR